MFDCCMNKRVADVSIDRYIYLPMRKPSRPRPKASRPRPHIRKSPRHPRSYTPLSDALSQLRIPGAVGQ